MKAMNVEDVRSWGPMKLKNVEDIYLLSPMQQGMLFHSLHEPSSGVYFVELGCQIDGVFDVRAFRRAWEEVIRRHAVLRTGFLWEGLGKPVQVVRKSVELPWREEDWRGWNEFEQKEKWANFLHEERKQGFDLKQAPLMRLSLMRTGEQTYYFVWNSHHILLDGWCRQIVMGEAFTLYEAYRQGQELQLKQPRPYRDYIAWLQKQDEEKAEAFWRQELKGFAAPIRLGIEWEKRELALGEEQYTNIGTALSKELSEQLAGLTRGCQVTLNTVVQGAWAILLSRYSGQKDVIFGATVSGRAGENGAFEEMVGLFINTLPVRVEVEGTESIISYLKRLQQRQARTLEYEYSPLLNVRRWSDLPPQSPLFENILVFENFPVDAAVRERASSGLKLSKISSFESINYPLALEVRPGIKLSLACRYSNRRFDRESVERMLGHLGRVLEELAGDWERRIGHLSLLQEAERSQVLEEWNRTAAEYSAEKCVHQLFEEQVQRTPYALALDCGGQRLTYQELNQRANQLANHLRRLGAKPEVKIGLCVERGLELVVGLFGILKAGAVYVPLDPIHPPDRLTYMFEDAQARVLLTQERLRDRMPVRQEQVVVLDGEGVVWAGEQRGNVESGVESANLAYVIYTSGSTGRPKGVEVQHQGLVSLVQYAQRLLGVSGEDRMLQFASMGFDVSIWEICIALSSGASLYLNGQGALLVGTNLGRMMQQHRLTIAMGPPSVWSTVKEDEMASVSRMMVGGEAVPEEVVKRWNAGRRFFVGYGPTEGTVCATLAELKKGEEAKSLLGQSVANVQVYVLDKEMELTPLGVAGELHIAGVGVARGYQDRPGLTAEKFIPNPFGIKPGTRLYRTGDRVRRCANGNLEFLGRVDQQVKIRGYRIELGEIEAVLGQCPGVRACAVVVQEDDHAEKRLVAYVVTVGDKDFSALGKYLKERLPAYMVPAAFVEMEELPLNPNGKVDSLALPKPHQPGPPLELLPYDEVESTLAKIWEDLLNVSHIGRSQTFLDLGGHSLLAIRLVSKIKEQLGQDLPLSAVFDNPTIEQLAGILRQKHKPAKRSNLVPINRRGSKRPLFFVHPGGGGAMGYRHLASLLGEDQPFYGFQAVDEEENKEESVLSVEVRATQYIEALFKVQPHGPYLLGGWSFGAYAAYEMARQLQKRNQEVARLILLDVAAPPPRRLPCDGDDADQLFLYLKGGNTLDFSLEPVKHLGTDERLRYLVNQLVQSNALSPEVEISQVRDFAKGLRRRLLSLIDYEMPPYAGPITLIRGLEGASLVEDKDADPNDPTLGFARRSPWPVQVHFVPGTHDDLIRPPHVQHLAEVIKTCLQDTAEALAHPELETTASRS
jgi:amino acid adenylation domain-containing protein